MRAGPVRGAVLPVRGDEARGSRPPPRRATRRPRRRFRRRRRLRRSHTSDALSASRGFCRFASRSLASSNRNASTSLPDGTCHTTTPPSRAAAATKPRALTARETIAATGRRGRARARGRAETRARLEGGDRGRGSVDVGSRGGVRARRRRRRRRWRRRWRRATARLPGGVRASRVERGSADRRGSAVERGSAVAPIVPVRRTKCRGELGERGVVPRSRGCGIARRRPPCPGAPRAPWRETRVARPSHRNARDGDRARRRDRVSPARSSRERRPSR